MQSIKASWQNASPYRQFMMLVFVMLVSVIIMTLIGVACVAGIFNINIFSDPTAFDNLQDPKTLMALKFLQSLTSIGMFLLPPLLAAYLVSEQPLQRLGLDKAAGMPNIVLGILVMAAAMPLVNHLYELNQHLQLPTALASVEKWMKDSEASAAEITKVFLKADSVSGLLLNIFIIALLPAIGEELLFRGFIQRLFHKWFGNMHSAVLLTAILFSSLHMQFYGFLPRVALGLVLGYMFIWSGSLWLPMIAHFVNNAAAVTMAYWYDNGITTFDGNEVGTGDTAVLFSIVSAVLVFALMWGLHRLNAPRVE